MIRRVTIFLSFFAPFTSLLLHGPKAQLGTKMDQPSIHYSREHLALTKIHLRSLCTEYLPLARRNHRTDRQSVCRLEDVFANELSFSPSSRDRISFARLDRTSQKVKPRVGSVDSMQVASQISFRRESGTQKWFVDSKKIDIHAHSSCIIRSIEPWLHARHRKKKKRKRG